MPNLPPQHPRAIIYNSLDLALTEDKQFANDCYKATVNRIHLFQERAHEQILHDLDSLPDEFKELPFGSWLADAAPINAIHAQANNYYGTNDWDTLLMNDYIRHTNLLMVFHNLNTMTLY